MKMCDCNSFIQKLSRKKYIGYDASPLPRVLTLLDLTALGVGSTVGVGFYVLVGQVARETAGPAVTISFLIAGIASIFAGLCYAEFGSRVPKSGSAYVYTYICIGEFIAFAVGWNLVLEYVIGTASVARGLSGYIDFLTNDSLKTAFNNVIHINSSYLSPYPDFFAFGIIMLFSGILCCGVKESAMLNNVFTAVNLFVITYCIIGGSTQTDPENWKLSYEEVHDNTTCGIPNEDQDPVDPWGKGGFAPYGISGIIKGAATCFFAFVGFDVIASAGEEAKRPERNIPLSICLSLLLVFVSYFGMATVLTLVVPYCMEDPDAPLIQMFEINDMNISKWIVSIGAIMGFLASLFGVIIPMPRIIYAMADDGIVFRFLSQVNKRFETPVVATLISGLFAAFMALLFTIDDLINLMSIGTLMAYTIVSIGIMFLRYSNSQSKELTNSSYMLLKYSPDAEDSYPLASSTGFVHNHKSDLPVVEKRGKFGVADYFSLMWNKKNVQEPTELTASLVTYAALTFFILCTLLSALLTIFGDRLANGDPGLIVLIVVIVLLNVVTLTLIARQPISKKKLAFKVPFLPWIPALSAFFNLYLMCNLSAGTWIRFIVWMILGMLMYFLYGIRHSTGSIVPSSNGDLQKKSQDKDGFYIPRVLVHPPTPTPVHPPTPTPSVMSTYTENSTCTIKSKEQDKRVSVLDSPLVNGGVFFSESTNSIDKIYEAETPSVQDISSSTQSNSTKIKTEEPNKTTLSTIFAINDPTEIFNHINHQEDHVASAAPTEASTLKVNTVGGIPSSIDERKTSPPLSVNISAEEKTRSDEPTSNSEPVTPSRKRHPFKFFRRASSFDDIPPGSTDSPLARRYLKFIIIPIDGCESSPSTLDKDKMLEELDKCFDELKYDDGKPNFLPIGSELDTIRERGESKISSSGDVDFSRSRTSSTNL